MPPIQLIECPREAWRSLPNAIPAEIKADYLRVLIAAGFRSIDAVSFQSRSILPQFADTERTLEYLDPPDDVEIIALVTTEAAAQRAAKSAAIQTLAFPYSLSPKHLQHTQAQTPEESLEALEIIGTLAYKAGMQVVAHLNMAFGNLHGDQWSIEEVVDACDLLVDCGVNQILLIDNAALATPRLAADVLSDVLAVHDRIEIGAHLYATPAAAPALIEAAYNAGCRRFSTSIAGLGLAADDHTPTLATEQLLEELKRLGADLPNLHPLDSLAVAAQELQRRYGPRRQ